MWSSWMARTPGICYCQLLYCAAEARSVRLGVVPFLDRASHHPRLLRWEGFRAECVQMNALPW